MTAVETLRADPNRYCASFCEENVYRLGQAMLRENPAADLFAVFVSNCAKSVAVWRQRKGEPKRDGLVVWDYHVLLVSRRRRGDGSLLLQVHDLDSTLPFPCELSLYLAAAFQSHIGDRAVAEAFLPRFRVLPMPDYLQSFASDRRHMRRAKKDAEDKENDGDDHWLAPPPKWPCLRGPAAEAAGILHNLDAFWDVEEEGPAKSDERGESGQGEGLMQCGFTCDFDELPGKLLGC